MLNTIINCIFSAGLDDLYFVSLDPAADSDIAIKENRIYFLSYPTPFRDNRDDLKVTYRAPSIDSPGFVKITNKYDDTLFLTRDGNKKKITAKLKCGNKDISLHSFSEIQSVFRSLISIEESRDNEFVIDSSDGTLLYYNGTEKHINLPSEVTRIGSFCFFNSHINSICGKNVTDIGESAFQNCPFLNSAIFPNVSDIYPRAFYDSGISVFYLNDNVSLHHEAFAGSSLTSLYNYQNACFVSQSAFFGSPFDKTYQTFIERGTKEEEEEIIDYITEDQTKYLEEGWEYEPEYALLDPTIENLFQSLPYSTIHTISGQRLIKRECFFESNDLYLFADVLQGDIALSQIYKVTIRRDDRISLSLVNNKENQYEKK